MNRPDRSQGWGGLFAFDAVDVCLDGVAVLSGVSPLIPDRGVTAVVGPSGAGKTTLLRLCNRLELPTRGRIWFRGQDMDELDVRHLRRRVGMVFQRPTLFAGTVRDNLLTAAPTSSREQQHALLGDVGLDPLLLDRDAATLSGGEAQRACLARTLMTAPEALLLDEPTASLHENAKLVFEATARSLADDGMPIVWISHDLDQVRSIADAVLVLVAGRVVAELDDVAELDTDARLELLRTEMRRHA